MKIIIKSDKYFPFIRLNTNCKQEEKVGSGPGSCGGKLENRKEPLDNNLAQSRWQDSLYGDDKPYPTKDLPKIIENYDYFEGSDDQLNGNFENPESEDAEFDYDKTTRAKIFYHGNIEIIEPDDSDVRSMNRLETSEIINMIDNLPQKLYNSIEGITINPFESIEDERAIASADQGMITIYGNHSEDRANEIRDELPDIIIHEAAHFFDGSGINRISVSNEWKDAIKLDGNYPSGYADINRNKPQEDFAESIVLYVNYNDKMKSKFPNRYNIINKLLS